MTTKQIELIQAIAKFTKKTGVSPHQTQMMEILGYETRQNLNRVVVMLRHHGILKIEPKGTKRGSNLLVLVDDWKKLIYNK